MALLLAGLPDSVPGVTLNRLCASGLEAVGTAARAIRAGEIEFAIAGGVESMTRAPFVHGQGDGSLRAHGRNLRHHHRLALHQSADEAAIRRRFHAGDRRERRRGIPGHARRSGRLRAALAAARRQGASPRAISPRRSSRSRSPAARATPIKVDSDEHPRRRPRWSSSPSSRRRSAIPARSPPAMPPASMTAPRR